MVGLKGINTSVTLDVIGDSLAELKLIREQLQYEAQGKNINVYQLRLPDGSIPILDVNIAVSNLLLAATQIITDTPRAGK